jgi:hypothetical protein
VANELTPAHRQRLYQAIVGERHQDYYLSYFARADARGYPPISWHWPVLFFGVFWFLYRRMYRWALASFALPYLAAFVAAGIEQFIPGAGRPLLWTAIVGFYVVWLPLVSNGLYYKQAQRLIGAAQVLHPADEHAQATILAARGGVHSQLPLILLGALTLFSMLMGSLGGAQQ